MSDNAPIAEAKARSLMKEWEIIDPHEIDLESIALDLGIYIKESSIQGSAARLICLGDTAVITVNKDIPELGRKRFGIAHEIGHFVLHRSKSQVKVCTEEHFLEWYKGSVDEKEASIFASELIMPSEIFQRYCKVKSPSIDSIIELSRDFNTSVSATAIRFVKYSNSPCAIIASCEKKIIWYAKSENFDYWIVPIGTAVHKYSCAFDYFSTGRVPDKAEVVNGIAWMEDIDKGKNVYFYEQALAMPNYATVLSLIWVKEDNNVYDNEHYESKLDPNKFTPDGKRYRW